MAKRVGANKQRYVPVKKQSRVKHHARNRALKKKIFRMVILSCIVGGAAFVGVRTVRKAVSLDTICTIKEVKVRGNRYSDTSWVMSVAQIQPGNSLLGVKKKEISDRLKKNPWIKEVKIIRRFPHTVIIALKERQSIALVNRGNISLVDEQGFLWPMHGNTFWNLPLVSGVHDTTIEPGIRILKTRDIEKVRQFFGEMKKIRKEEDIAVSQVVFKNDDYVTIKLEAHPVVISCNRHHVEKSLHNALKIMRIAEDNARKTPRRIDLYCNNIAFVTEQ